MRIALLALLVCCGSSLALAQSAAKPRLAFEDTTKLVSWNGAPPQAVFAWDGQHIVVTRRDADGKPGELWVDPRTGKEVDPKAPPANERSAKPAPAKTAYQAVLVDGDIYLEQFQGVASDRGAGRRRGGRSGSANSGAVLDRTRLTEDGEIGRAHV